MLKNATYKEKFVHLKKWVPAIIDAVKKDLKNDHLKKDLLFVKQNFSNKNVNKLTAEELSEGYLHALENNERAEELAEFIANRWLLKHTDLYHYFEAKLSKISANFNELEELNQEQSSEIVEGSIQEFGSFKTYLFSVLNSVVFPKEVYDTLALRAEKDYTQAESAAEAFAEMKSLQDMQRAYEQQIARLTDKYEKKLLGLQKKYAIDVDGLKKQVVTLQRKLSVK